jgi:hypothetical protein
MESDAVESLEGDGTVPMNIHYLRFGDLNRNKTIQWQAASFQKC